MTLFSHAFLVLALTLAGLTLSQAAAQPSESAAVDDAIACLSVENDSERLACLEAAATTLRVTRVVREEQQAKTEEDAKENFGLPAASIPARRAETPEEFGKEKIPEVRRAKDGKRIKSLAAKIVEIRLNAQNVATISLDNGQVWRQLESDDRVLRFGAEERLYTAEIKRKTLGNFMLKVPELNTTIRVRRIK